MSDRLPYVIDAVYDQAQRLFSLMLSNGERQAVRLYCKPHDPFQNRVSEWMHPMFGSYICLDVVERRDRFTEEALELAQACGATAEELHALVDYVMGRPVGEVGQEVGGVMVTLAALCGARGIDMHELGDIELERIWSPEVMQKIRTKQRGKPDFGPLPGPSEGGREWSTEAALRNILTEMGKRSVVLDREAIEALLNPGADSFKITWIDSGATIIADNAATQAADRMLTSLCEDGGLLPPDAVQPVATDNPAFSGYSFDVERLHNSDRDTFTFTRTLDGKFYLLSRDIGRIGRYWKAGPFDTLDEAAKAKDDSTYYEGMQLGIVQGIMTHPITGDPI